MLQEDLNGQIDALTHYGQNLGMAFQITDDLLDLTGEEGKLGKAPGNDIREGRLTLPFIRALSVADDADRKRIAQAFSSGRADDDDLKGIRDAVRRSEGIEYSLEKARDYGRACRNGLASVAESESRACLALLVDHVVGRAC